jgi:hypothetical protein
MAFSPKYGFLFLRLVAQEENILSRLLINLKAFFRLLVIFSPLTYPLNAIQRLDIFFIYFRRRSQPLCLCPTGRVEDSRF